MNHLIFKNTLSIETQKEIYFSMGCFWGAEQLFWNIHGVVYTEVGYANGNTDDPSCSDIFRSDITHREVVRVTYDTTTTNLENMLKVFFENHTVDFGIDQPVPEIYKSAIYYSDQNDLFLIEECKEKYKELRKMNGKTKTISTEINQLTRYIVAHEDHQQYTLKHENVFCPLGFNGTLYKV